MEAAGKRCAASLEIAELTGLANCEINSYCSSEIFKKGRIRRRIVLQAQSFVLFSGHGIVCWNTGVIGSCKRRVNGELVKCCCRGR
jgi:hypothetical protein